MDIVEMGVTTRAQYQRRGYATLTCAHLIRACEERGYRTYWNCAKQNLASAAVARKLGYRREKVYRLLAWFKSGQ
jgi:RimJ/RimL family protein N-acetyltransferase